MLGERVVTNERTSFNMVDALSVIGGFSGTLFLIIRILLKNYEEFAFYSNMI